MPSTDPAKHRPVTFVIGAGPGLGRSVAERFGRDGHRLGLVARRRARSERVHVVHATIVGPMGHGAQHDPAGVADTLCRQVNGTDLAVILR